MSTCLSQKDGSTARKKHYCPLCGEIINPGDKQDTRSGVGDGAMWTMHMHPECHRYEQTPEIRKSLHDDDWYGDVSDPAFDRADAIKSSEQGTQ